mmetsp:Transcript_65136/g.154302  ORF Transcript_65136/g.154302 Transcript_65136/m.154302 type:complete len:211 (-) Transcript_65136:208-840(-)
MFSSFPTARPLSLSKRSACPCRRIRLASSPDFARYALRTTSLSSAESSQDPRAAGLKGVVKSWKVTSMRSCSVGPGNLPEEPFCEVLPRPTPPAIIGCACMRALAGRGGRAGSTDGSSRCCIARDGSGRAEYGRTFCGEGGPSNTSTPRNVARPGDGGTRCGSRPGERSAERPGDIRKRRAGECGSLSLNCRGCFSGLSAGIGSEHDIAS